MKRLLLLLALLALAGREAGAQNSSGNYRVPYRNGIDATVIEDASTHPLPGRVDLRGVDSSTNTYWITAAADGTVRAIRDSGGSGCVNCTNYVWIQHANGEWTGYFHLRTGSAVTNSGISVGDTVVAGQNIGIEGSVGSALGVRLRFEVGVPNNPNAPVAPLTGMLLGTNRVPVICNITDNVFRKGVRYTPADCVAQEISYGTYRLPYTNGVILQVTGDHLTHSPRTRLDLTGEAGMAAPYAIVAAASGVVRAVVQTNFIQCNNSSGCSASNNYVWIQHNNGEWTKYTHFQQNSVVVSVGQNVVAGQFLGLEGAVGFASGVHLHFEVGVPRRQLLADIDPSGGFLTNGANRIPLFCGVSGGMIRDGEMHLASPCAGGGCDEDLVVSAGIVRSARAYIASDTVDTAGNSILVDTYGSLALLAGNKVTFRPGFRASGNSYVRAAIRPCFNPP